MSTLRDVRKNEMKKNTTFSEVRTRQESEGLTELYSDIQALRKTINDEKVQACKDVETKYSSDLATLEQQYAILLSMSR